MAGSGLPEWAAATDAWATYIHTGVYRCLHELVYIVELIQGVTRIGYQRQHRKRVQMPNQSEILNQDDNFEFEVHSGRYYEDFTVSGAEWTSSIFLARLPASSFDIPQTFTNLHNAGPSTCLYVLTVRGEQIPKNRVS